MARKRDPKRDEAFNLWINGTKKLKDIAEKLGVSEGTVRGWKAKDKWDRLTERSPKKKQNAPKETERSEKQNAPPREKEEIADVELFDSCGLTFKQRKFVAEYLIDLNATQAAKRAGYSEVSARQSGAMNMANPTIMQAVQKAFTQRMIRTQITADAVLCQLYKMAFADMAEFVTMEDGQIRFRNLSDVDGTLITEITSEPGQWGTKRKLKLTDRLKALKMLGDHLNLFNDKHKQMINEVKVELERERLELEKMKVF